MTMRDINRGVALSGWIFILLVCSTLIGTWAYVMVFSGSADKEFTGAAMLALGFLFGNASNMIKDIMLKEETP